MRCQSYIVRAFAVGCLALWPRVGSGFAAEPAEPATSATNAAPAAAPVALTNASLARVDFPKSSFSIDIDIGKDPFFPGSSRRDPKPVEPPPPPEPAVKEPIIRSLNTNTVVMAKGIVAADTTGKPYFKIKGLSGSLKRRFVTLHTGVKSYDFTTGEEMLLRVPEGQKRVRCLEIRNQSAVFQVEGEPEPIELNLRDGI